MSFSFVNYTGNGTQQSYPVPFPYISPDHVAVLINGTATTAWAFTDPGTILLTTAPASGAAIKISRNTPKQTPLVEFSDTSVLTETDLLLSDTQNLYCVQEISDKSDSTLTAANAYTDQVRATFEPLTGLSPTVVAAQIAAMQAIVDASAASVAAADAKISGVFLGSYTVTGGYIYVPLFAGYKFFKYYVRNASAVLESILYAKYSTDGGATYKGGTGDYTLLYHTVVGAASTSGQVGSTFRQISNVNVPAWPAVVEGRIDMAALKDTTTSFSKGSGGLNLYSAGGTFNFTGPITHMVIGAGSTTLTSGEVYLEGFR